MRNSNEGGEGGGASARRQRTAVRRIDRPGGRGHWARSEREHMGTDERERASDKQKHGCSDIETCIRRQRYTTSTAQWASGVLCVEFL
eukprot:4467538-Pyramimonas_sp.AAC.1